jgi:hypothetical protein
MYENVRACNFDKGTHSLFMAISYLQLSIIVNRFPLFP